MAEWFDPRKSHDFLTIPLSTITLAGIKLERTYGSFHEKNITKMLRAAFVFRLGEQLIFEYRYPWTQRLRAWNVFFSHCLYLFSICVLKCLCHEPPIPRNNNCHCFNITHLEECFSYDIFILVWNLALHSIESASIYRILTTNRIVGLCKILLYVWQHDYICVLTFSRCSYS